jgi:hypothetical protein
MPEEKPKLRAPVASFTDVFLLQKTDAPFLRPCHPVQNDAAAVLFKMIF